MKKVTTVTICLVMAITALQYLLRIPYYKYLLGDSYQVKGNIRSIIEVFTVIVSVIVDIIVIVLGALALGQSTIAKKEKAYALFRYIYVMMGIFYLMLDAYYIIISGKYFFHDVLHGIIRLFVILAQITFIILLIRCKPTKTVQKVNLTDYDMVAYTSTGHRLVHYLLDFLFLIPVWFNFILMFIYLGTYYWTGHRNEALLQLYAELLVLFSYLFYCFISEAIFRQTFGKIVTRSCVVSNGVELSTGRVFLRTLARLIPFDRFSFLFGAKWHDRASSTAVVYIDSWEKAFDTPNPPADGE